MVCLVIMLSSEPIFYCLVDATDVLFTDLCPSASQVKTFPYSTICMIAMLLYYALLLDLGVFSNRLSAYMLVCNRMFVEVLLFIAAMGAIIMAGSSAFSCLHQKEPEFHGIQRGSMALFEQILGVYSA